MTFKHLVGKSTLKEGITIHKSFESFFDSPDSGQKKELTILYGNDQVVTVALRRLANIRSHVHIKYTNKTHAPFLQWLNEVFAATKEGSIGEFIEFQKMAPDVFRLSPITLDMAHKAKLYVADSLYHKADKTVLRGDETFGEVETIINSISFKVDEGQSFYNREIERAFSEHEWQGEIKAIPDLDLKCDYRKDSIQVEVEFGNARAYYQDYIKFMLSYFSKQTSLGHSCYPDIRFCKYSMRNRKTEGVTKRQEILLWHDAFRKSLQRVPISADPI